jgi:putative transposase
MPTSEQVRRLERNADARRFIWNWGLDRRLSHYRESGENLAWGELSRELTRLKASAYGAWLRAADSQALQQGLRDLYRAFRAYFEGDAALPRFKSKKTDPARFRVPQRVTIDNRSVRIPKVGAVRVRISQPVLGVPGAATFKRDQTGKWFVTLVCRFHPESRVPSTETVGIDLGIRRLATLSSGEMIENPRTYRRSERRLRRAHRELARKRPDSRNRARQRRRLARVHAKARNRRIDHLHKLTTSLVDRYGIICIEDLNVRGLARAKLSKDLHDAALGEIRRQLLYKSEWRGQSLVTVPRFFPSTKTCSRCGAMTGDLHGRAVEWTCNRCGASHDRDLNAARNIVRVGLAQHVAAGHADIRTPVEPVSDFESKRPASKQEPSRRDAKNEVSTSRAQRSASL